MILFALALLAAPDPSPEALALGRRLAETGSLASILPTIIAKDREELVGRFPELSEAEKAELRATADAISAAHVDKLMAATGRAYAETLSVEDLRALVAFNESAPARHWRAATPAAVMRALAEAGDVNFQEEARKAYCSKTGKACERR